VLERKSVSNICSVIILSSLCLLMSNCLSFRHWRMQHWLGWLCLCVQQYKWII